MGSRFPVEPERCRATGKIRHPDPVTAERVRKRVRRAKGGATEHLQVPLLQRLACRENEPRQEGLTCTYHVLYGVVHEP